MALSFEEITALRIFHGVRDRRNCSQGLREAINRLDESFQTLGSETDNSYTRLVEFKNKLPEYADEITGGCTDADK